MIIMNAGGGTIDLSAVTDPTTLYANAHGFGDELTRNPMNPAPKLGGTMPFPGGYKAGPVRTSNPLPGRNGVLKK